MLSKSALKSFSFTHIVPNRYDLFPGTYFEKVFFVWIMKMNVMFCTLYGQKQLKDIPQKKESHTGLERSEDEYLMTEYSYFKVIFIYFFRCKILYP